MAVATEFITAAIGVVGGASVSVWTYRVTLSRQRNREVREQLVQIVDLRLAQSTLNYTNPPNFLEASYLLNGQRTLRLAIANELAEKTHRSLTPSDCLQLASESYSDGEYGTALRHLERALGKSRQRDVPVVTQAAALRSLGLYFIGGGPDHDPGRGDRFYREAVGLTEGDPNPYFVYTTAISYHEWGKALGGAGDERWREVALQARQAYQRLPVDYAYRATSLAAVDALLAQTTEAVEPPPLSGPPAEPPRPSAA